MPGVFNLLRKKIYLAPVLILVVLFLGCLPDPLFERPFSLTIEDRSGHLLGAAIARDEQWRFPLGSKIPEKYIKALVLFEDKRFFSHPGVDPMALARAAFQDLKRGAVVSGGSTITMQVIRLSRQGRARTFLEKAIEIIMALRLEMSMDKQEILALFASHAPFGGNIVGIEAASFRYFGCEPQHLSWAEAAMLAVLPNSPSLIHPGRNRKKLKDKRDRLLEKMEKNNIIDPLTYKLARAELLPGKPHPIPMYAPHLLNRIAADTGFRKGRGVRKLKETPNFRIRTTIDRTLQRRAVNIINRHHRELSANGIENSAALIIEVATGNILVYVGNVIDSSRSDNGTHVDIITSPRSTGSILKPFLYAAMLQAGEILPSQLVADTPVKIGGFAPENYSKTFQGAVPAYMALARSLNIPAVRMLQSHGVDRFYTFLKQIGITTLHRPANGYGLTLILGGAEGTLWDITGAYAAMAGSLNRFFENEDSLENRRSSQDLALIRPHYLFRDSEKMHKAGQYNFPLGPGACYLTFQAMLEVVRPGNEGFWRNFTSSKKIAWKTGTSYGYRDGWAVGVTPEYVVGVWVGNADGEGRAGLTGASSAAPVMFDLFGLLDTGEWFDRPESRLIKVTTCARSGFRAGPDCKETRQEYITFKGTGSRPCPYCRAIHCDSTHSFQVESRCERVADIKTVNWFVLPPVAEYFYKRRHADYQPLPPFRSDCQGADTMADSPVMSIIYPDRNGMIYIPTTLGGKRGKIVFEAAHRQTSIGIYWHLDQEYVGMTREIHQMELAPGPGAHILTLVDETGEFITRKFTVLSKD